MNFTPDIFLTDSYFTNANMGLCDDGDDAPDIQNAAPAPMDSSILSGGASSPPPPVAPPDAISGGMIPPTPDPNAPAAPSTPAPDANAPSGGPMPNQAPDSLPKPPQAAGVQSVWKNIAMGALFGAVGGAGQKTFSGGIAAGGAKVLEQVQQQKQNQVQQQELQFESIKAADDHIRALDQHNQFNQETDERKLDIKMKSAQYQSFLQENFGIKPDLTFNDSPTDARAAMQTASQANGGKDPPVSTIQQPAPNGQHGQIAGYSPSQAQM